MGFILSIYDNNITIIVLEPNPLVPIHLIFKTYIRLEGPAVILKIFSPHI